MDLKAQVGPLKVWQWGGVVILAAAGFLWWRSRQAGSSTSGNLDSSSADTSGNVPDYSTGYDAGLAAGENATGYGAGSSSGGGTSGASGGSGGDGTGGGSGTGTGGTNPPLPHNRYCVKIKDPAGKMVTVCGYGTWKKVNGKWTWDPYGTPPGGRLSQTGSNTLSGGNGGAAPLPQMQNVQPIQMPPLPVGQHTTYAAA